MVQFHFGMQKKDDQDPTKKDGNASPFGGKSDDKKQDPPKDSGFDSIGDLVAKVTTGDQPPLHVDTAPKPKAAEEVVMKKSPFDEEYKQEKALESLKPASPFGGGFDAPNKKPKDAPFVIPKAVKPESNDTGLKVNFGGGESKSDMPKESMKNEVPKVSFGGVAAGSNTPKVEESAKPKPIIMEPAEIKKEDVVPPLNPKKPVFPMHNGGEKKTEKVEKPKSAPFEMKSSETKKEPKPVQEPHKQHEKKKDKTKQKHTEKPKNEHKKQHHKEHQNHEKKSEKEINTPKMNAEMGKDLVDPMDTMQSLSSQIKAYIAAKQSVIAEYKRQISEYEAKITAVQKDLKEHQTQFRRMISEIDQLTSTLTKGGK